jgi:hypothetical protein
MWHSLDGQCLNATWHNLDGQWLNVTWHNLNGQCLNFTWHSLNGQCLDVTWLNLGCHCLNAPWHLLSQNGVWPIIKSFDYYIDYSKVIVEMTSHKCQPRLGKKIHDLFTMDMFKSTCPKWLRGFFDACPKWVFFDKNL